LGQAPDLDGQARAELLRVAAAAGLLPLGDERLSAGLVGGGRLCRAWREQIARQRLELGVV